jgi:succinoglycan biosynthesis protein ExoA
MSSAPLISVIIPVRPGTYPDRAVEGIRSIDSQKFILEVLVSEGTNPSRQRNQAARIARGDFLYFLDDDSKVSSDTIWEGLQHLLSSNVEVVGGPALTRHDASPCEGALGAVLGTFIGGGLTRARNRSVGKLRLTCGEELVLCNLMLTRELYLKMSGLKESLYPGEEVEFLQRLNSSSIPMLYNPSMIVERTQRQNVGAFIRQIYSYGVARGRRSLRSCDWRTLQFVAPSILVGYLILLCFSYEQLSALPLMAYGAALLLTALTLLYDGQSLKIAALTPPLIVVLHVTYGISFLIGRIDRIFRNEGSLDPQVTVRKVSWNGTASIKTTTSPHFHTNPALP